jgi:hypothetical protein
VGIGFSLFLDLVWICFFLWRLFLDLDSVPVRFWNCSVLELFSVSVSVLVSSSVFGFGFGFGFGFSLSFGIGCGFGFSWFCFLVLVLDSVSPNG